MVETELIEYLQVIRKRIWFIIAVTLIAALSTAMISLFAIKPVYEAKTSLIIGRTPNNNTDKIQYNDVLMYQNLVKTYGELAKSDLVAAETIAQLGLNIEPDKLQKSLNVNPKNSTQILEVTIQGNNAKQATEIANTLSKVFVNKVKELMNSNDVKILDEAKVPEKPIKPRKTLNTAIAALLGLIVSFGISLLLEYIDNTVKTEEDVQKYLGLTVLASIPYQEAKK